MAVTKELLQMDLYALLGIGEKAADKEVRTGARRAVPERPGDSSGLGLSPEAGTTSFPGSTRSWVFGNEGSARRPQKRVPRPFLVV